MTSKLKIIPLGGVGEIGKNMTLVEYGNDIIIIDCGLSFPDEEMLGIDLVIPDMTYLEKNSARIRGILITHGHEDHIGAVSYALKQFNVPVFGTKLSIGLIKHKLDEQKITDADLTCIQAGDKITLGCFEIEFIKISHSIAGAVALAIRTPLGTLIHTGDFKLDMTPLDGEPMDMRRLAWYGSDGVLALMSDSTNVERSGYTQSEKEIGKTFEHYFDLATGRVVVASFASNIYRIQQVADVAVMRDRVICFQGRSMVNIANMAMELGYLSIPKESVVDIEQLKNYPDNRICIITTGSQGEPMSGLFRMANASHKLNIGTGDTVIISASAIPGNEKGVAKVINQLFQRGAKVVYDSLADVHVSGHARQEELKLMIALTKPKFFIPVHGELRHLYQHSDLAVSMGVQPENTFIPEIGGIIEFTGESARIAGSVPCGSVLVDGLGIGDIGNAVLKDRRLLSLDGLFTVVIALDKETGELCAEPEIVSRGFVYVRSSEELLKQAKAVIREQALLFKGAHKSEWAQLKNQLKNAVKDDLYAKTKRTPMILPIIIEIDKNGGKKDE